VIRPDLVGPRVHHALIRLREKVFRCLWDLPVHHVAQRLVRDREPLDLDVVGLAELDPHAAAVAEHPPLIDRVVIVGVGDTALEVAFELVFRGVRRGITALPESFDELVALFVVGEQLESLLLFVGDDPAHIFVKPLFVGLAQLDLQRLGVLLFLLIGERTLERISFRGRWRSG
jgi:hypothetical protein